MSDEPESPTQGLCHLHAPDSKGVLHHLSLHSSLTHAADAANQYFAKWRTTRFRLLHLPGLRHCALLTDADLAQLALDHPLLAPALVNGKLVFSGTLLMLRAIAKGIKPTIDLFEPQPPEA